MTILASMLGRAVAVYTRDSSRSLWLTRAPNHVKDERATRDSVESPQLHPSRFRASPAPGTWHRHRARAGADRGQHAGHERHPGRPSSPGTLPVHTRPEADHVAVAG